ncbi:MAG: cation transporter [Acidimicrobiia bacterium]|nr:cation transporter [Acidimicrobiia bacterium]
MTHPHDVDHRHHVPGRIGTDHHGVRSHGHDHGADHVGGHGNEHRHRLLVAITSVLRPHSHDAGDKVDDALTASAEGMRALKISLLALSATAAFQLVIVLISGSVALLADTVHNFSDALTAVPIGIAFVVGRRRANRRYTYGYGRAEDIAGLFVLLTMLASAVLALYEAVDRLLNPRDIEQLGWVAVAGLVGFVGNELVALYRIRVGNHIGSAALVADGLHARTDGLTSLAVLVGAGGVAVGWRLADPIVGLFISVAIFAVLYQAAKQVFGRMMDRVDESLVAAAEAAVRGVNGVVLVDRLRMRWIGHELVAEVDVRADATLDLGQAHHLADDVRARLVASVGRLVDATVEVSPATAHTPAGRGASESATSCETA